MADDVSRGEPGPVDPLREQLLDAAASVFASKGYSGTKIQDIVRAAGLSIGAAYGRFDSKDDLLMEAVLSRFEARVWSRRTENRQVGEAIVEFARSEGPLDDAEAMRLEAYVAARREAKLAAAIVEGRRRWRMSIEPLVQKAIEDGTADPGADIESIVYLIETLHLGLLVQRCAGIPPPDAAAWLRFLERQLRAAGRGAPVEDAT